MNTQKACKPVKQLNSLNSKIQLSKIAKFKNSTPKSKPSISPHLSNPQDAGKLVHELNLRRKFKHIVFKFKSSAYPHLVNPQKACNLVKELNKFKNNKLKLLGMCS
jgi:hypothetical protein